jgi:DNA-binding response OmpR family regulator
VTAQSKTILILDDDEDLRGLLRRVLERDGWEVVLAADAPAALELCERQRPALMIVDLMLPHMDGEEFLEEYRSRFEGSPPAVVLLSASEVREEVARRLELDVSLPKPFEIDEIREIVRQYASG